MKPFQSLTVADFQELYRIHRSGDDEIDKSVQSISLLSGKPRWEVEEMDMIEFRDLSKRISILYSCALVEDRPTSLVKIKGKKYRVCLDPRKLTAGQYIDLQTFLKEDQIVNLHKTFACLLTPKGGKYSGEDHPQVADGVLDLNFQVVHSTAVFFLRLWKDSIRAIVPFLNKEMNQKMMSKELAQMISNSITDGFLMPTL